MNLQKTLGLGLVLLILLAPFMISQASVPEYLKVKRGRSIERSPSLEVPSPAATPNNTPASPLQIVTNALATIGRGAQSLFALVTSNLNLPFLDSILDRMGSFDTGSGVEGDFVWDHDPLTVSIRLESNADPSSADLVKSAIIDWQARIRDRVGIGNVPPDSAPFGVRFVSASSTADIIIHLVDKTDSVLGTATVYYRFGKVARAEVVLATKTAMQLPLDRADVQNVASHEFGHALGLGHSLSHNDIMYESYDFVSRFSIIHPSVCDVDRLIGIYMSDGFAAPNNEPRIGSFSCN